MTPGSRSFWNFLVDILIKAHLVNKKSKRVKITSLETKLLIVWLIGCQYFNSSVFEGIKARKIQGKVKDLMSDNNAMFGITTFSLQILRRKCRVYRHWQWQFHTFIAYLFGWNKAISHVFLKKCGCVHTATNKTESRLNSINQCVHVLIP